MKTISSVSLLAIISVITLIWLSMSAFNDPQIVTDIKNGNKQLECNFNDGLRTVDGSKVLGIDDVRNRWIFTNGSVAAQNCEVY